MALDGKLDKYSPKSRRSGGYRSEVKRHTRKKSRRQGKKAIRDGGDAPVRPTVGWAD